MTKIRIHTKHNKTILEKDYLIKGFAFTIKWRGHYKDIKNKRYFVSKLFGITLFKHFLTYTK